MSTFTKPEQLEAALTDVHALASGALKRIHGSARCALRALETPAGVRDLESIAQVLTAIALDAEMISNDIDCEMERQDIYFKDKSQERRFSALNMGVPA